MEKMFQGFEPVFDKNSKILILGSFPSVKSRLEGFYYGHPQNRFWKMLSQVFEDEISSSSDIPAKKDFLKKHNIALFDVVSKSNLRGSADSSLIRSNFSASDISFLLPPHTKVQKILCNGKTAFNILAESFKASRKSTANSNSACKTSFFIGTIPVLCLPSTSSANPRFSLSAWHSALLE